MVNKTGRKLFGLSASQGKHYYDGLDQLIREDNQQVGKTFVYTYDDAGNIVSNKTYSYTTGSLASATPSFTFNFTYGDEQWGDLLTTVNGMPLTYDAIGNITSVDADGDYPGYFTWEDGRLLTEYRMPYDSTSNTTLDFKYDDAGIRTEKIFWDNITPTNSMKHEYVTDGASIVREIVYSYVADSSSSTGYAWAKSMTVYYFYDDTGAPLGMRLLNNAGTLTTYYYRKNLQGDILGVITADGYEVVTYTYDAWGERYERRRWRMKRV